MSVAQEKYYSENRGQDLRRSTSETGPNHWVVSDMWELHHEITRRLVLGQKGVDIAKALGCTPQTVSNVRNSPVAQDHIAIMKGARDADTVDLSKRIIEIAPRALTLLEDIIKGENDGANASLGLRAKEANGMLARVGHGIPQKIQSESVNYHVTSEQIADIKRRAFHNDDVIDVTPEDSREHSEH